MEAAQLEKAYTFRPYTKDDIPLIQNSWGKSYYGGVYGHSVLTPKEFHDHHRPIRLSILDKPTTAVIIACSKDDPDFIIGYSVIEKPLTTNALILHYLYVKFQFRGEGIASELLKLSSPTRPVFYTHQTVTSKKLITKSLEKNEDTFDRFLFAPHLI